jgi:hypothetical protein
MERKCQFHGTRTGVRLNTEKYGEYVRTAPNIRVDLLIVLTAFRC